MRFTLTAAIALLSLAALGAAQAATDTLRVDARQARQEARIANGVANGSLSRPEARHLQHQQRHIRQAERQAKADGTVTAAERQQLARLQHHASRSIHRQKHDAQVRPQRAG